MDTIIWILQGLLALTFLMSGAMKFMKSKEGLIETGITWTEDFDPGMIKIIGVVEIVGAAGLIIPALIEALNSSLVVAAAWALAVMMVLAVFTHIRRGNEFQMVMINSVLFVMLVLVALERA